MIETDTIPSHLKEQRMATVTRKSQILAAVDDCLSEYSLWMADEAVQHIPVGHRFDAAIGAVEAMCAAGDVPTDCRQLVDCVARLDLEYQKYHDGEFIPRTKSPTQRFHAAVEAVSKARGGAEAPPPRRMESVRELRRQNLSDSQIATCFARWDDATGRYVGPFHDPKGRVLHLDIQNEFDKPGTLIPSDWIHPNELAERERSEQNYADNYTRLNKLREDDKPDEKTWTEADVVAYLREGAFIHQVVHVYGISQQDVIDIANRAGIDIDRKQPGLDKGIELPQESAAKFTDEKFRERVYELADGGTSTTDIVKALRNEFQDPDIKAQRVSQLLIHRNKAAATAI